MREPSETLGWRVWYDDGGIYTSADHDWADIPEDGLLVKMIYYADGTRQVQQGADWYFEAPHHSGETTRGFGNDEKKIRKRYKGAVLKMGKWVPDRYYRRIVNEAMTSKWIE